MTCGGDNNRNCDNNNNRDRCCGEIFDGRNCRRRCRDERFDCATPWWWRSCAIRGTECSSYGRPWNFQRDVGRCRCERALCCRRGFGFGGGVGGCGGGGCGGGYGGYGYGGFGGGCCL